MRKSLILTFAFCTSVFADSFAPDFECEITPNAKELGFISSLMEAEISTDSTGKYCWYKSPNFGKLLRAKFQDGTLTTYYANGNPRAIEPTKNGKRDGWQKVYYKEGSLQSKFYAKAGKMEGLATDYYESGILQAETTYKNDEPDGISKSYYESGKKAVEIPYVNGKMNGKVVYFCENGQQAGSGNFIDGELDGFMESADGVRGNEDFDVIEHYCPPDINNEYDLMKNQRFSKDIERILRDVSRLQTTGQTVLGGRRDIADEDASEKYTKNSYNSIGDGFVTKAKGSIKTPSERDIKVEAGSALSIANIMKVVRQRTPGLRHIYNKYVKQKPGFQGKVTLKFTIATSGEIIKISIISSTTGYSKFDNEIRDAVSRWKFNKTKSGKTTVTIPFTFSE